MVVGEQMIAKGLRGFNGTTEMCVRVLRINDNIASVRQVEVITSDVRYGGYKLWLDETQLSPIPAAESPVYAHHTALIAIG